MGCEWGKEAEGGWNAQTMMMGFERPGVVLSDGCSSRQGDGNDGRECCGYPGVWYELRVVSTANEVI